MNILTSKKKDAARLLSAGFLAGAVNGLLGAGGGILIISALSKIMKPEGAEKKDIFVSSLCIMLPISAVSCLLYALEGRLVADDFELFVLPTVAGGIVGGLLSDRLKKSSLKRIFALLVIVSGILLIMK